MIFMTYNDNSVVAWPKAGQRDSMENMFHNSGLKGSVLWAGNYFKHNTNYYNNDIQNINISSNFNETYYINHEFDSSNKRILTKICNLKGKTIDWESCIYSRINEDIDYPDDLYNTYMSIINKIDKSEKNYDEIYVKIKDYMLSMINHLASETKAHYDNHDELKKRATDIEYLEEYALLFALTFPNYFYDFISTQKTILNLLQDNQYHWGHVHGRTRETALIIAGQNEPDNYFDLNGDEYFNRAMHLLLNEESVAGHNPLIDTDNMAINEFIDTDPDVSISDEETFYDFDNLDRMSGYVADGQQELNDLLDNIGQSMLIGNIPSYPVYVINLNGEFPGVAANAIRFINNNIDILSFGGVANAGPLIMRYVDRNNRISRNDLRSMYAANERNYNSYRRLGNIRDLDEFPFNTLRLPNFDGENRRLDPNRMQEINNSQYLNMISVSQVDALDNQLDGMYWSRRIAGYGHGTSRVSWTSNLVNTDHSRLIPNSNFGGTVGRINFNDLVYIVIRIDTDTDDDIDNLAPPAKKRKT